MFVGLRLIYRVKLVMFREFFGYIGIREITKESGETRSAINVILTTGLGGSITHCHFLSINQIRKSK